MSHRSTRPRLHLCAKKISCTPAFRRGRGRDDARATPSRVRGGSSHDAYRLSSSASPSRGASRSRCSLSEPESVGARASSSAKAVRWCRRSTVAFSVVAGSTTSVMLAIAAFPRLRDASSASDARGPSRRRSETPCAADPAIDVGSEERKKRSTRALFLRERKPGKAFALRGLATPTTRVTPRAVARAAVRSKLSARPSRLARARACARASTETTTGKVNVVAFGTFVSFSMMRLFRGG